MFYDKQPNEQKEKYKEMLTVIGGLSNLFSDSTTPYLYYRCHENLFCKYFNAENLSREDCSADAKKGNMGIGLKTWVGGDNQKVAEFNKLKGTYSDLQPYEMVCKIAEYRNERIRVTKNLHGINEMVYHIVKREPNMMYIYECTFDFIDINRIKLDIKRGNNNNNIYFNDGRHDYHFNLSKSTLYMVFENMELLDSFEVEIMTDPYSFLEKYYNDETLKSIDMKNILGKISTKCPQLCLRLYSVNKSTGEKIVNKKSGLNQWNASGRVRNINEVYIPYPSEDRRRSEGFFPNQDEPFELYLPDGTSIQAKICQQGGKAIMSNPNSALGEWLLRKVFELDEGKILTYDMLKIYGIDSVIFTKINDKQYKIDFAYIGTYEKLLGIDEENLDE